MERRCSCAEVQIFSPEACIYLSRKPDFRAFYSPDHLPCVDDCFWLRLVTPKRAQANKIHFWTPAPALPEPNRKRQTADSQYLTNSPHPPPCNNSVSDRISPSDSPTGVSFL